MIAVITLCHVSVSESVTELNLCVHHVPHAANADSPMVTACQPLQFNSTPVVPGVQVQPRSSNPLPLRSQPMHPHKSRCERVAVSHHCHHTHHCTTMITRPPPSCHQFSHGLVTRMPYRPRASVGALMTSCCARRKTGTTGSALICHQ